MKDQASCSKWDLPQGYTMTLKSSSMVSEVRNVGKKDYLVAMDP